MRPAMWQRHGGLGLVGFALGLCGLGLVACESDHECGGAIPPGGKGEVAADPGAGFQPAGQAEASPWSVQRVESKGALVSVWGSGPTDVWAAGGRADLGLVLHNDGSGWSPVDTGAKSFLWWIYGLSATDVYAVGDQGLILHFDGKAWTQVTSGTKASLFGVWAGSGDDVWIVGGNPHGATGEATVLRGNAKGFQKVNVPNHLLPSTLYKVYGSPATLDNPNGGVVAVGAGGTVLRYDGPRDGEPDPANWRRDEVPTESRIISLWGAGGDDLYAVGGEANGILLHYDGATWKQVGGVQAGLQLYGVFKAPGQPVFAVGAGPRIVEWAADAEPLESDTADLTPGVVLHSVWGDGAGTVYAVGGTLFGDPGQMTGVVLRRQ